MKFDLNLTDNPKIKHDWEKVKGKNEVKDIIGGVIVDMILKNNEQQKSSVKNKRNFKPLSEKYADKKEAMGRGRKADLELLGDMASSIIFKRKKGAIQVGVFGGKQGAKADGHNNHSGESSLPPRKFIPKTGEEDFKPEFYKVINKIIKENINGKDKG